MSPLTHGLNYRSACDFFSVRWSKYGQNTCRLM